MKLKLKNKPLVPKPPEKLRIRASKHSLSRMGPGDLPAAHEEAELRPAEGFAQVERIKKVQTLSRKAPLRVIQPWTHGGLND